MYGRNALVNSQRVVPSALVIYTGLSAPSRFLTAPQEPHLYSSRCKEKISSVGAKSSSAATLYAAPNGAVRLRYVRAINILLLRS